MKELSKKPYFLRAIYDWCTDNGYTPYLMVFVDERSDVPHQYVSDGKIVLNIGAFATNQLTIDDEYVSFQARFSGVARDISVHVDAVMAIFSQETGDGMHFEIEPYEVKLAEENEVRHDLEVLTSSRAGDLKLIDQNSDDTDPPPEPPKGKKSTGRKPALKVVK